PVILLHGWADMGMSFQFLADEMPDKWYLIAPDWRGFGDSDWQPGGYWFPDYLADLESIIDELSPDQPVRLVGHSMGGNVAWLYAGIRPERVSHAVSLDVYGMPDSSADEAPAHYLKWLEQLKTVQAFSDYKDIVTAADRIIKLAPRLQQDRAVFLAQHWCRQAADGVWQLKHDPAHKRVNPVLYRREEAKSCWRNIRAKTLLVLAEESAFHERYIPQGYQSELEACISLFSESVISETGHMLHLEQPQALAAVLDSFLE
ncbi:MAG: alpha/beta hydrolase, partial [Gammaproteobacteria bacterium]